MTMCVEMASWKLQEPKPVYGLDHLGSSKAIDCYRKGCARYTSYWPPTMSYANEVYTMQASLETQYLCLLQGRESGTTSPARRLGQLVASVEEATSASPNQLQHGNSILNTIRHHWQAFLLSRSSCRYRGIRWADSARVWRCSITI